MLNTIKYALIKVFSIVLMWIYFLVLIPDLDAQPYTVLDEDNLQLKVTTLSDCHIAGNEVSTTLKRFGVILQDMNNCEVKDDLTLFLGDSTNTGQYIESIHFYGAIRSVGLEGPFLNVPGNHDTGNDIGEFETRFARFQYFNKYYLGLDVPAPYYYKVVNGYYFIVISSETDNCHEPLMTETQLNWFKDIMEEASHSGKPIFVCSHHHYRAYLNGVRSEIYATLNKYQNVFYMYGHTHNALCEKTIRSEGINDPTNGKYPFTVVNVPSSRLNSDEEDTVQTDYDKSTSFIGFQIEVYNDSVVFRPRNYYDSVWSKQYQKTITLTTY